MENRILIKEWTSLIEKKEEKAFNEGRIFSIKTDDNIEQNITLLSFLKYKSYKEYNDK